MVNELISTILQLLVVLLVALAVYAVLRRPEGSFARFLGLYRAPWPAIGIGLLVGLAYAGALLLIPEVRNLAAAQGTVAGGSAGGGLTLPVWVGLAIGAIFKTALSEEIFFRGLIGRTLIRRIGFAKGNLIQAVLFGCVHFLLLLIPGVSPGLVILFVLVTGSLGWVNGWVNERRGGGSILPGWTAHGTANLIAYTIGAAALG